MIPIEETLVSIPMAVGLGLVFGMSACTLTCLPYLGPVLLASQGGIRKAWRTLLPFSLGRLTTYAGFATAAGAAGRYLEEAVDGGSVRWVVGLATIMIGLALLWRRQARPTCTVETRVEISPRRIGETPLPRSLMPGGLFLMGAGMALTPCMPLGMVLFSAAAVGSAGHGLALGLGFGLGAIFFPSLVFGVGVAYLSSQLRERLAGWRSGIERLSALLLIIVGMRNLLQGS